MRRRPQQTAHEWSGLATSSGVIPPCLSPPPGSYWSSGPDFSNPDERLRGAIMKRLFVLVRMCVSIIATVPDL